MLAHFYRYDHLASVSVLLLDTFNVAPSMLREYLNA